MSGGNEGSKERKNSAERIVYRRKSFKGLQDSVSSMNSAKEQHQQLQKNQEVVTEDANSGKRQVGSGFDAASDNFSGLNQEERGSGGFLRQENRVSINLAVKSKREVLELRKKLENERELIRSLMRKIEGEANVGRAKLKPVGELRPLNQLNVLGLESQGGSENVEKEKRTPKVNQFYRNSEFLLAKDKFPPADSNKKSKPNNKKGSGSELVHGLGAGKLSNQVLKSCNAALERLMKHKHGWVFNQPVDPRALNLHDYFDIIRNPMDLGTVKTRLNQNFYKTPMEFAEDVRLTFQNAMTYNPQGQDVHVMAEQLLKLFEEKWVGIEADYMRELKRAVDYEVDLPTPTSRKAPQKSRPVAGIRRIMDRSESTTNLVGSKPRAMNSAQTGRTAAPKKPKAKDPNKRDMTFDEKQKLSINLQNLPTEKLENVVQIIKKRNPSLSQHDDEIEVDIDSVDTETLWELDRFVTNYKKSLSKNKRKAEVDTQLKAAPEPNAEENIPAPAGTEAPTESNADQKKSASPTHTEKQGNSDANRPASPNSSSSDSGVSSSDSDSGSSSGNGSDPAHSPKN